VPELRALASYYARQGGALWVATMTGGWPAWGGRGPLGEGAWEICKIVH